MKLLNEEIRQRFKEVGSQENVQDPLVIAKFFDPYGSVSWFATEYEPEFNICFGYVTGLVPGAHNDEWGRFSIDELESLKRPFGLTIERDLYIDEKPISELVPELAQLKKLEKIRNRRKELEQKEELER